MITTREYWWGLYYDKEGNVDITLLYEEDEGFHYTNDPRVDEIVFWINRVIKANKPSKS